MAVVDERQGHLGDLQLSPTAELQELLARQYAILKNSAFVKRLPDKGEKIRKMVARLEGLLHDRQKVDDTAGLFQKLSLNAEQQRCQRGAQPMQEGSEEEQLWELTKPAQPDKMYISQESHREGEAYADKYHRIVDRAEEEHQHYPKKNKYLPYRTINSEHVEELQASGELIRIRERLSPPHKKDFNGVTQIDNDSCELSGAVDDGGDRTVKLEDTSINIVDCHASQTTATDTVTLENAPETLHLLQNTSSALHSQQQDMPSEKLKSHSLVGRAANQLHSTAANIQGSQNELLGKTVMHPTTRPSSQPVIQSQSPGAATTQGRLRFHYDEALYAAMGPRQNKQTKLIGVDEAAALITEQKKKSHLYQAQLAGEQLSQRLGVRMHGFNPEGLPGSALEYREKQEDASGSSSSTDDDYPD